MEGLVRASQAQIYEVRSALPSLSRPLYETLMTGLSPVRHGITSNAIVRRSNAENVFSLATAAGLSTAAAAYSWYFELYNRAPFASEFRHIEDFPGDIRHGSFYWDDAYPDSHLFADADCLLHRHAPDFMVLHPMSVDHAGHRFGGASLEYRNAARNQSDLLARYLPRWLATGYAAVVTSDHGMSDDGNHGGLHRDETLVPLYAVHGDIFTGNPDARIEQTQIAGLLCALLGIAPATGMEVPLGMLKEGAT